MSLALYFWLGSCIYYQGKSTSAALRPGLVSVCGAKAGGKLGRVQRQCVRVGLKVKKAAMQYESSSLLHATRLGQCVYLGRTEVGLWDFSVAGHAIRVRA